MRDQIPPCAAGDELDLGSYFPFQIALISSILRDELGKSCVAEGISISDWRVMTMIANQPGIVASDVVQFARLNEVSVHRAIKKMMGLDLVERVSVREDRRQKRLRLTEAGREVYGRLVPAALTLEQAVIALLPEGEREIVLHSISQLFENLMKGVGLSVAADLDVKEQEWG